MHEQKRFVIVAAFAVLGFAGHASAQKDAAEKAREGSVEHWIEYYKAQQRKPATDPANDPVASPVEKSLPAERNGSDPSTRGKVLRK